MAQHTRTLLSCSSRSSAAAAAAPVITFLSSSVAASYRAVDRLCEWTSLVSIPHQQASQTTFHHVIPWSLTTLQCQETGVTVQWVAPASSSNVDDVAPQHSLLAIQAGLSSNSRNDSVNVCNDHVSLANHNVRTLFQALDANTAATTLSRTKIKLCDWFRRPIAPDYLLGPSCVPFLQLDLGTQEYVDDPDSCDTPSALPLPRAGLKELVIPMCDDEDKEYDATTISQTTSSSSWKRLSSSCLSSSSATSSLLTRPATGLYLLQGCLCLRPLPTAKHDRQLPPPSLIFHCSARPSDLPPTKNTSISLGENGDKDQNESRNNNDNMVLRKIGHTGVGGGGQYRLDCEDFGGLDVRLCSSDKFSSMFAEAQESLLASSLEEVQSSRVLGRHQPSGSIALKNKGGDMSDGVDGRRKTNVDCWMEFRATLRNPLGYFRSSTKGAKPIKPPDLPYE